MLHVDKLAERCEDECCTPPPLILSSKPTVDRHPLVREAFRLESITRGPKGEKRRADVIGNAVHTRS